MVINHSKENRSTFLKGSPDQLFCIRGYSLATTFEPNKKVIVLLNYETVDGQSKSEYIDENKDVLDTHPNRVDSDHVLSRTIDL
jgi:hypothetical protein